MVEDFARTLSEEMDFRLEADNMERMRRILADGSITDCRVPMVYATLMAKYPDLARQLIASTYHAGDKACEQGGT